jgi:phasin
MAGEGRDRFELSKDTGSVPDAGFEQARKSFERFIAGAQAAADSLSARTAVVSAGAKDVTGTVFSYAEKNVQASLDYAQALIHAKNLSDVMRLHREYIQAQMRAVAEQASEMGQIASRAARDVAKLKK